MMSFTSKVLQSLVCAIVYWIFVYCISLPLTKTILRDHQQFMNINDLTSMTFDKISSRELLTIGQWCRSVLSCTKQFDQEQGAIY